MVHGSRLTDENCTVFEISRGGTLRVTAAVHRFINYVMQYEKCDPNPGEIPLSVPLLAGNCEPDNLNSYTKHVISHQNSA